MLLEAGLFMKMILDKALNEDLIFGAGIDVFETRTTRSMTILFLKTIKFI